MAQSSSFLLNIKNTATNTILPSHVFSSTTHPAFSPSSNTILASRVFSSTTHPTFSPSSPLFSKINFKNPAFSQALAFGPRSISDNRRICGALQIRCASGSSGAELQESIKTHITQNPVVIYSKTWCPYCQEVKGLFQELGVKPFVVELDELGTGERQMQDALKGLTEQSTVPNIFVGGKHIGGCSDTMDLHQNGELTSLLSAAGVNVS
uniref:TSA: Wollemia nobilis Ref_Wollemi_Transcript_2500_1033 transcribed RNA sequence n=1 Tax=Wollemia nobilis TaxID=56998 RepID=A0A0C9S8Y1_9CONI